jgi:N-acetyl-gamma-glutamyl-phosphate reductase
MTAKVFIDGEAGTTGLQIRQRLDGRNDIALISIDSQQRKDPAARAARLNEADIVILCLPDDAAREAVMLITNPAVKVIDASTAHRVAEGWTFGFPEMEAKHRAVIATAKRVTNPGCWATGAIALLRPLLTAGLMGPDYPVCINGVSGYSGGGKGMISEFENVADPTYTQVPYRIYGLDLQHKHVPEIQKYSSLPTRPFMAPSVGRYAQGMLVQIPLHLTFLSSGLSLGEVHDVLTKAYKGEQFVEVVPLDKSAGIKTVSPEEMNGTNRLRIYVFGKDDGSQAMLVAQFDNLGKGASGQAVQNMNIMLGLPEAAGLN